MSKIKKIYIVDDDAMFRKMLVDHISSSSRYEVTAFETGEDCLKGFMKDAPDLVILDYFLNAVNQDAANGMIILDKIRKDYPDVHVIMLSGQGKYGVAATTIAKGAEQYVMKDNDAFKKITSILLSYK